MSETICKICGRDMRPLMARLGRNAVWQQHNMQHREEALKALYQQVHILMEKVADEDPTFSGVRTALAQVDRVDNEIAAIEKGHAYNYRVG